jgi:hypothetical protein
VSESLFGLHKHEELVSEVEEDIEDEETGSNFTVLSNQGGSDMFSTLRHLSQSLYKHETRRVTKAEDERKKNSKRLEEAFDMVIKAALDRRTNAQNPILFHLADATDLFHTKDGTLMFVTLAQRVAYARSKGARVLLVASVNPSSLSTTLSTDDFGLIDRALRKMQLFSSIGVFPPSSDVLEAQLKKDQKQRVADINLFNMRHSLLSKGYDFDGKEVDSSSLEGLLDEDVYDEAQVDRIVSVCSGLSHVATEKAEKGRKPSVTFENFKKALHLIEQKDLHTSSILQQNHSTLPKTLIIRPSLSEPKSKLIALKQKFHDTLNAHEKKLWNSVIDPGSQFFPK